MRDIILSAKRHNWDLKTRDDWDIIEWKIYDDKKCEIVTHFYDRKEKEEIIISEEEYQKIIDLINKKSNNIEVDACDGEAWEMKGYNSGKRVLTRKLGYIYGVEPFEEIANILICL